MRSVAGLVLLALGLAMPGARSALAQEAPAANAGAGLNTGTTLPPPVLKLDQEQLFRESAWGKGALARAEAEGQALIAENRRIEEALQQEEQDLTNRRPTMSAEDFGKLAADFDTKVEGIRAAQDGKSRAISRQLEADRQRFYQAATPVLEGLLKDAGAVAILSDSAFIMSLSSIDVTAAAIARMDEALPEYTPEDVAEPAPGEAPDALPPGQGASP